MIPVPFVLRRQPLRVPGFPCREPSLRSRQTYRIGSLPAGVSEDSLHGFQIALLTGDCVVSLSQLNAGGFRGGTYEDAANFRIFFSRLAILYKLFDKTLVSFISNSRIVLVPVVTVDATFLDGQRLPLFDYVGFSIAPEFPLLKDCGRKP